MWDNDYQGQTPDVPVDNPTQPNPQPQAPAQAPSQPPFAPDGSYRYVPPREGQPAQNVYYQPVPQQPTPPPTPKKNGRGWIVVVAVLAVLAVLISGMSFAFWWVDRETAADAKEKETASQSEKEEETPSEDTKLPNENAPSLEQKPGEQPDIDPDKDYYYGDGGLSTETIVSKNYASTVVLTMYMNMSSYPYYGGEGGLQEVGSASGIVWTADGYIITNCHCVIDESTGKEFDRIDVTMYDGTVYEGAEVIGADESTDLAVIKVKATDLTPAEFGDSDQLSVGSRVVAMGNAMGLSWTATQGIVSAKARDVYEDNGYAIKCLQVDAAINSGNSGGPLLNKYGQVVGINSAKIVADGVEGLGFSIPINEAKVVLESLAKYGYVKGRVALGITGQTVEYGFLNGFMIVEIAKDSCLKGTDAAAGDIIVAVDDVDVTDYGTLRAELAKHKVGDKITLKLLRVSRTYEITTIEVEVTLKEQTANR